MQVFCLHNVSNELRLHYVFIPLFKASDVSLFYNSLSFLGCVLYYRQVPRLKCVPLLRFITPFNMTFFVIIWELLALHNILMDILLLSKITELFT